MTCHETFSMWKQWNPLLNDTSINFFESRSRQISNNIVRSIFSCFYLLQFKAVWLYSFNDKLITLLFLNFISHDKVSLLWFCIFPMDFLLMCGAVILLCKTLATKNTRIGFFPSMSHYVTFEGGFSHTRHVTHVTLVGSDQCMDGFYVCLEAVSLSE